MKTSSPLVKLLVPLLAALSCVSAQVSPKYFVIGGNLELRPSPTDTINSIVWKHKGNLLAEWVKDAVNLTYYGQFRERTTLDITTGALEIQKMTTGDVGSYTVEINSKVQAQSYEGKVIQKVVKPSVWVQPLTCSAASESCTLTCDGETGGAEPVEYSWMKGDKKMEITERVISITSEAAEFKTFSCSMKNPVSEAESEPKENPFYQEQSAEPGIGGGGIAAIIFFLVILPAIIVGVLWRLKRACFSSQGSIAISDSSPRELENGRTSPHAESAKEAEVMTPEEKKSEDNEMVEKPLLPPSPGAGPPADPPSS